MLRLGTCSDVVVGAATCVVGAEPEGHASHVCPVGGPAAVVASGTPSVDADVCAG